MMCIKDEAADIIREMRKENNSPDLELTLSSAGAGCGTPAINVSMKSPLEDDIVTDIDGITFHIRAAVERYLDGMEIIAEDTFWGKKLKVKTVYGCR